MILDAYHRMNLSTSLCLFMYVHWFSDMSTENLQYLTVDQALADVAAFSDFLQEQYRQPLTFFTFGGSYPGALSAW